MNIKPLIIKIFFCLTLICFTYHCPVTYGEIQPVQSDNAAQQDKASAQGKLSTLKDIIQSMEDLQKDLDAKKIQYKSAETEEKKTKITSQMNEIITTIDTRQREFETIALGTQIDALTPKPFKKFDIKDEIQEIFRPFIEELKNITSRPREIEKLRKEIGYYEKQLPMVQQCIVNINKLTGEAVDPKLKKRLLNIEKEWQEKEKDLSRQIASSKYQLEQKTDSKQSIIKTLQSVGNDFFKTRGINLLLAVLTFFGIFILFRFLYWWIYKSRKTPESTSRSFYSRLFQVIYHAFTFFVAVVASLFLLYNFGDWMLLSIAIIFFVAIAWTTRNGFSMFWEQAKFILNIGTVRDAERLVYDGVPWKVVSLNLLTTLENPELQGGIRRLPLQSLIGLQSRPFHDDELWFPSRRGDYVVLADNTFGKVRIQTPETVTLEVLGGCLKTYPSTSFLSQNPINLSINNFGIGVTFGMDYEHQSIITHEIPEKLKAVISEKIVKEEYGAHFLDILVQFKEAGASSLDILIFVKFSGQAAEYYYMIGRSIQKITVDACNEYGWGIPFPQITVHQGK